jgi:hypothetical protein
LFVLDHYQTRIGGDGESNRRPGKMSAIPQAPASVLRVE